MTKFFALVTAGLAVVTAIWSNWIELVFRVDPDHGNGILEWGIVIALGLSPLVLSGLARVEWLLADRHLASERRD